MALAETLSRCIALWQAEGIRPGPAIAEDTIRQAWSRFGKSVSRDVITLYSTLGGFAQYELTKDFYWSLWPWDMVKERNCDEQRSGVLFCDHSIEICTWELRYENEDVSSVWLIEHSERTARSLESFLEIYLEDPWKLL